MKKHLLNTDKKCYREIRKNWEADGKHENVVRLGCGMAPLCGKKTYLVMFVQLFRAAMSYIFILAMIHSLLVYQRGR